jgi:NAD(P)H-hydrate epimerase
MMYFTREQVREVDRRAIECYGMNSLVLMENAGRGCVDVICRLGVQGPVVVCCGRGNNGGDGLVIARHLDLRGIAVRVVLFCRPEAFGPDGFANYAILAKTDVPIYLLEDADRDRLEQAIGGADWIVDALLGTGARGEPRTPLDIVIPLLNEQPARRMAVDLPSGLDCDSGQPAANTFRAHHTCTFVREKRGFQVPSAGSFVGQIHVLDIGAPAKLIREIEQAG